MISFLQETKMAGRNRGGPRRGDSYRGYRDAPRNVAHHRPAPLGIHPAVLEEELELQRRDMQRIIMENRTVIDENTLLQRELEDTKDEIHRLSQVIPKLRAEKEMHARELMEKNLTLDASLRAVEPLRSEVMHLRSEAQKLNMLRQEMSSEVQGLTKEVNRLQNENQQLKAIKSEIDMLRKELAEARGALEYEKKANEEQMEQKLAMEKNLVAIAREIEKLRAEQMNTERRRGLGIGAYGIASGSPDMRYHPASYGDGYTGPWAHYDKRPRH
uniref:Protein FLX-like 3 n=1 Tax=Kalanchoe fedtschenkoi TaxID=63787 RepID=A0A7N0UDY1_KALFE